MRSVLAILIGLAIGLVVARLTAPREIVCDHPIFVEGRLAPYSTTAECGAYLVTILD